MLHSVQWQFLTKILEQPISPSFLILWSLQLRLKVIVEPRRVKISSSLWFLKSCIQAVFLSSFFVVYLLKVHLDIASDIHWGSWYWSAVWEIFTSLFYINSINAVLKTEDSTELFGEWGLFESSCVNRMVIVSGLLLTD
jgi:hypothetical protein